MEDIRDSFFDSFYNKLKKDKKLILISVDQGALVINKIKKDFPKNYLNVGISEQNAMNFAIGLAQEGYKPYIYLISPFIIRCLEQIKIGMGSLNLKICIVGSGSGYTYASDGPTHYINEDYGVIKNYSNINFYCTSDPNSARLAFKNSYTNKYGSYIRLEKGMLDNFKNISKSGINHVIKGDDVLLVSNGYITRKCIDLLNFLNYKKKSFGLLDINQLLPLNKKGIEATCKNYSKVVFMDESPLVSSYSKDLYFYLNYLKKIRNNKFFFINTNFEVFKKAGNRDYILSQNNFDKNKLIKNLNKIKDN
jgi:transketolase